MRIEDGSGKGFSVKVNNNKRLHVHSVSRSEAVSSAHKGDAFNLHSGTITFTAAGTVAHLTNNEDEHLIIEGIIFSTGSGTVLDSPEFTFIRNAVGGDLITDATPMDYTPNRNYGSNKELLADTFKGKSGGTITGGTDSGLFYIRPDSRVYAEINLTLVRGSSLSVKVDPKLASGSIKMYVVFVTHISDSSGEDDV